MKKILVVIDGLGDLGCKQFGDRTPLEEAETPNLDEMAKKGQQGIMYPVKQGVVPQSDSAVVAILGNNPTLSSRGQFCAKGMGIKLERGDLAVRANFETIENIKNKHIINRRAGRTLTTKEARQLAKAINKEVKLPVKFELYPTLQHRAVLVLRGGFSDNITDTDTHYSNLSKSKKSFGPESFSWSQALDDSDENSEYTANIINSFIDQSFKVLNNHNINKIRVKRGLMPANIILTRGAGIEMPKLRKYNKAMAIVSMSLEKGICGVSGMNVYGLSYPKMRRYDVYENLYNGLIKMAKYSVKILKRKGKKYDFCYIHFKETDIPGHDNKPYEKKNFIEIIDKRFFSFLKRYAEKYNVKVIVTGDHSTPCKLHDHSADPVPVLLFGKGIKSDKTDKFSEVQAKKGDFGTVIGKNLLKKAGFIR